MLVEFTSNACVRKQAEVRTVLLLAAQYVEVVARKSYASAMRIRVACRYLRPARLGGWG
jgi:hypothetical protein